MSLILERRLIMPPAPKSDTHYAGKIQPHSIYIYSGRSGGRSQGKSDSVGSWDSITVRCQNSTASWYTAISGPLGWTQDCWAVKRQSTWRNMLQKRSFHVEEDPIYRRGHTFWRGSTTQKRSLVIEEDSPQKRSLLIEEDSPSEEDSSSEEDSPDRSRLTRRRLK